MLQCKSGCAIQVSRVYALTASKNMSQLLDLLLINEMILSCFSMGQNFSCKCLYGRLAGFDLYVWYIYTAYFLISFIGDGEFNPCDTRIAFSKKMSMNT